MISGSLQALGIQYYPTLPYYESVIQDSRANALLSFKPIKTFNCPMWCFHFQEIAEQKRLITNQTNQLLELERMRQIIFDITGGKKA